MLFPGVGDVISQNKGKVIRQYRMSYGMETFFASTADNFFS